MRKVIAAAATLASLFLLTTNALANTYIINLAGGLGGGQPTSVPLSGLSPIVVSTGDTLSINLTLDGPLTVPAGSNFSYVDLYFSGTGFDGSPASVTDNFTLFNSGVQIAATAGSTGTSGGLVTEAVFFNQSVTFDSLTDTSQVLALASPVTLSSAYLETGSIDLPEPSTWFLLFVGFGGVGLMMRRARRLSASGSKDEVTA